MRKAKPIFLVGVSDRIPYSVINEMQDSLSEKFTDYHVLIYTKKGHDPVFQCLYEKDFNEVKFNELKEMIQKQMTELK
jgi:hypothetical protein